MPGGRTIRYNGRNISVPADATDAEIAQVLDASDGTAHQPAEQPGLLQRVWNWATTPTGSPEDVMKAGNKVAASPGVQSKFGDFVHQESTPNAGDEFVSGLSSPAAIAANVMPFVGPEANLAARVVSRIPGAVLAGSNIASGASDIAEGHPARGAAQVGVGLLGAHGATEGLGHEVRPLVGKVARVGSDIVDPELTGVFSPRLGNAQRLLGRLADKIEKEAGPTTKGSTPIPQGPSRKPLWADIPNEARPNPVAQFDQAADEASMNKFLDRKAAIADVQNARANQPAKPPRVPLWKRAQQPLPEEQMGDEGRIGAGPGAMLNRESDLNIQSGPATGAVHPKMDVRVYSPENNPAGTPGWLAAATDADGAPISGSGESEVDARNDLLGRVKSPSQEDLAFKNWWKSNNPPPKSIGAAAAGFGEENPRVMSSARAEHESDQSLLAKLRDDLDAHGESAAAGVSKMGWMGNKAGYDPVLPLGPNAPSGYQTMHGPVNPEGAPMNIETGEMPSVGGGSLLWEGNPISPQPSGTNRLAEFARWRGKYPDYQEAISHIYREVPAEKMQEAFDRLSDVMRERELSEGSLTDRVKH